MTRNLSLVFTEIPENKIIPGKTLQVQDRPIDLDSTNAPTDGLVLKTHYASFDPYQRGRMRDVSVKSYAPAYPLNETIKNGIIATVVKSRNSDFKEGDLISLSSVGPIAEYAVVSGDLVKSFAKKLENPFKLDTKTFLGVLGMPGLTAYSSFYDIGKPKKGETIFISAASGAVGALVAQLAKREGLKVIGSVGTEKKLKYIKEELGVDGGFNYKEEKPANALKRLAPDGIDIYFESKFSWCRYGV